MDKPESKRILLSSRGSCALETSAGTLLNGHQNLLFKRTGIKRSYLCLALAWVLKGNFWRKGRLQEKQSQTVHHGWPLVSVFFCRNKDASAAVSKCKPSRSGDIVITWWDPPPGLNSIPKLSFPNQLMWTRRRCLHKSDRRNKWGHECHSGQCKDLRWHTWKEYTNLYESIWRTAQNQTISQVPSLLGTGYLGQIHLHESEVIDSWFPFTQLLRLGFALCVWLKPISMPH